MLFDVRYNELERLKEILEEGGMSRDSANNFMETDDYEDEYSHNEIEKAQYRLLGEMEVFLRGSKYQGEYALKVGGWCIHVVTVEFLNTLHSTDWIVC